MGTKLLPGEQFSGGFLIVYPVWQLEVKGLNPGGNMLFSLHTFPGERINSF